MHRRLASPPPRCGRITAPAAILITAAAAAIEYASAAVSRQQYAAEPWVGRQNNPDDGGAHAVPAHGAAPSPPHAAEGGRSATTAAQSLCTRPAAVSDCRPAGPTRAAGCPATEHGSAATRHGRGCQRLCGATTRAARWRPPASSGVSAGCIRCPRLSRPRVGWLQSVNAGVMLLPPTHSSLALAT